MYNVECNNVSVKRYSYDGVWDDAKWDKDIQVSDIMDLLESGGFEDTNVYDISVYTSRLDLEEIDLTVRDIRSKDKDPIIILRTFISAKDYPPNKYYVVVDGKPLYGAIGKEALDTDKILEECKNEILHHNVTLADKFVNISEYVTRNFCNVFLLANSMKANALYRHIGSMGY